MAQRRRRKMTLADLDRAPSWAQGLREQYLKEQDEKDNRASRAAAIVDQIAKDDPSLSEDTLARIFEAEMAGQDWDASEPPPADFSNVSGEMSSTEREPSAGLLRRGLESIGLASSTASAIRASTNAAFAYQERDRLASANLFEFMNTQEQRLGIVPSEEELERRRQSAIQRNAQELEEASTDSQEASARVAERAAVVGENSALGRTARAVGGFAGQAEYQGLPLLGGVVGSVAGPAGSVAGASAGSIPTARMAKASAYMEAREEFQATEEEANDYANIMAAIEFAPSAAGGAAGAAVTGATGRLGLKSFTREALRDALASKVRSRGVRIGGAMAAEGLDEVAANELSTAARRQMNEGGFFESAESQEALAKRVAADTAEAWSNRLDAFMGGAVGGGITASPVSLAAYASELGSQEATTRRRALESSAITQGLADMRGRVDAVRGREVSDAESAIDRELTDTALARQEAERRQAEIDAAYDQRDTADTEQAELETEAGFQTIERDADLPTSRVERYAGVVERVPVNPAQEISPEQVAQQREADAQAEAERLERVELGTMTETLRKEQEALSKTAARKKANEDRAAKAAETKRRRDVARQLLEENPGRRIDDPEMARMLRDRLAQPTTPAAAAPATTEATPAPAAPQVAPVTKPDTQVTKNDADAEARRLAREAGFDVPDALSMVEDGADHTAEALASAPGSETVAPEAILDEGMSTSSPWLMADGSLVATNGDHISVFGDDKNYDEYMRRTGAIRAAVFNDVDAGPTAMLHTAEGRSLTPAQVRTLRNIQNAAGGRLNVMRGSAARGNPEYQQFTDWDSADADSSLSMADNASSGNQQDFVDKVSAAVRNLTRKNTKETADIQNLIRQGKLVFVPNAASVGGTDTGSAVYQPADGIMYVYTDNLDPNDTTGAIMLAVHEATHAGQFNAREGRAGVMASLLNDLPASAAKVRQEARRGNTLAADAVRQAEADTTRRAERGDSNPNVYEDHEILAYLASEAAKRRNAPLGGVRNVLADMRAGARNMLRDNLGVELDVTFDDLVAATRNVAGEVVATNMDGTTPVDGSGLSMIYNNQNAGFQRALDNGWVYDSVDGRSKYVLSDADARIREAGRRELLASGEVPLSTLMDHDVLYTEQPDAKNLTVRMKDSIPNFPGAHGMYDSDPDDRAIYVTRAGVVGDPGVAALRDTLMHEAQHYVQDMGGYLNEEGYRPTGKHDQIKAAFRRANDDHRQAARSLLDAVRPMTKGAPKEMRSEVMDILMDREASEEVKAAQITDTIADHQFEVPTDQRPALRNYVDKRQARNSLVPSYRNAINEEDADYRANITEREGFRTQYDTDMDERDVRARGNPEEQMRTQEAGNPASDRLASGRIDVPSQQQPQRQAASAGLSMAADSTPQVPREALSTKERVNRMLASAIRQQTADIKMAEAIDQDYRRALRLDLGASDATPEQQKKILAALQSIDNADSEARAKLWNEFKKEYPNLYRPLLAARTQIDKRTDALIRAMLGTGIPLTPEEARQVTALIKNRGRYLTRSYNAFQGQAGREWRQERWDNFQKYLNNWLDTDGRRRLNRRQREDVEAVYNAVQFFKSRYTIPTNDALIDMNMDELEGLYRDYGGLVDRLGYDRDSSDSKSEALVNSLAALRDSVTPEQRDLMSRMAVEGLLGLTPSVPQYAKVMERMARDPGTLKKKDMVPDEIRELLGEMKNPGARILSTLASQASLLARQHVYLDLLNNHYGTLVVSPEDITKPGVREAMSSRNLVDRARGRDRKPVRLEGAQYGPLNGYWVHPHVADALTSSQETFNSFSEAWDTFAVSPEAMGSKVYDKVTSATGALTRWEKVFGVVYNPARGISNWMGSWLQLASNGNIRPSSVVKGHRTAADYVFTSMSGGTTALVNDAYRYINLEAADIGEIQHILGNSIKDYMDGKIGDDAIHNKIRAYADKYVGGAHRGITASYAVADNWTKVANFYDRLDTMQKYYAITDPSRSIEDIKQEAGNTVNYTNISYERVPKPLKVFESAGLTKFVPYFYEAYRTRLTNYNQAILDLRRAAATTQPEAKAILRNAAMRRLIGNTLATAGMPAVGFMRHPMLHTAAGFGLLAAVGSDDDHESLRRMVGEFAREQDLINFGMDENNNPVFLSFSDYFDPFGPANDMVRMFINTPEDELPDAIGNMIVDMVITPAWLKAIVNPIVGRQLPESTFNELAPQMVEALQNSGNRVGLHDTTINTSLKVLEGWVPGMVKAWAPYSQPHIANPQPISFSGVTIPGMKDTAELATNMNRMGFRFETLSPQRQLNQYGRESADTKLSNRRWLNSNLVMARNLTQDRLDVVLAEYAAKEIERLSDDYKNVQSMRAWGYSDADIAASLKVANRGRAWSKDEIAMLMDDEAYPIISVKSLVDTAESRLSGMPESAKKDYTERVNRALDNLAENKERLEAMGYVIKEK